VFIIALVENVVASVPDIPLYVTSTTCPTTPARGYMYENIPENTVIIPEPDTVMGHGAIYFTYYSPLLLYPPPGYKYVIVFPDDPELSSFIVWTCTGRLKYRGQPVYYARMHGDYLYRSLVGVPSPLSCVQICESI